jgi:hypothetical protein
VAGFLQRAQATMRRASGGSMVSAEHIEILGRIVQSPRILSLAALFWLATFAWHYYPYRWLLRIIGRFERLALWVALGYASLFSLWWAAAQATDRPMMFVDGQFLVLSMGAWILVAVVSNVVAWHIDSAPVVSGVHFFAYACAVPYFGPALTVFGILLIKFAYFIRKRYLE